MTRCVAVDWSGARDGGARKIWTAIAEEGRLVSLVGGRDRSATVDALIHEAARGDVVIGLDFAFSFPAWFLAQRGVVEGPGAWALAEREGEAWLAACPPPFWGRPGRPCPRDVELYRRTEREQVGPRPKSVFQIGGAGAVGTGSIRGMPFLTALRRAGCAIWPFDAPRRPLVVEIWPRQFTGPMVKSDRGARAAALAGVALDARARAAAEGSEDAFDAVFTALGMAAMDWDGLRPTRDAVEALEGAICAPRAQVWT